MNKRKSSKWKWALGLALALTLGMASIAMAQSTPIISRWIIGGGGGLATGGNVSIESTLGQAIAGPSSGGSVTLQSGFWAGGPAHFIYLPAVLRNWPPRPSTPVLNPISNPDGYGSFTVSWSTAEHAASYVLEEAKDSAFVGAVEIYSDVNTSYAVSGRGAARYYYRVKARNQWFDSAWSDTQQVDVLWEAEPNNSKDYANGPLVSNLVYHGYFSDPDDSKDYYFIKLDVSHTIEVWLENVPANQNLNLHLYDSAMQLIGYSGNPSPGQPEHILTLERQPGIYYIYISRTGDNSQQPYNLRTVYAP